MARRKTKSNQRKPFWERVLEWNLMALKRLAIPALLIWLVAWMSLGGVFERARTAAWNGFVNWTASKGMVVEDVVATGHYRTDKADLKKNVGIEIGQPILSVDVNHIQNAIAGMPWVKDVTVARGYNGIVTIKIDEKIPFVIWDRPGRGMAVVDTYGKVIEGADPSVFLSLLVVRGVDAPKYTIDLMRIVLAEPTVAEKIRAAVWVGDRRWDLITVTGIAIHLPENDVGFAIAKLAKAQDEKNILDRDLLSVDLRGQDRIIIETERGRSHDMMNLSSVTETNTI